MRKFFVIALCLLLMLLPGCSGTKQPIPDNYEEVTAPADKEAINLALQSLRELGGGTLTLSEGIFIIDGPINLISNMILQGQGENTVIKLKDGFNQAINMIYGNGVSNVTIRNLVVDGNKENQTAGSQYGIRFDNSGKITIENVTVRNCRNAGIRLENTIESVMDKIVSLQCNVIEMFGNNNKLLNSTITESTGHGILIESDSCIVTNNIIRLNDASGILMTNASNCIISQNNISENSQAYPTGDAGIIIQTSGVGSSSNDNNIQNNTIRCGTATNKHQYGIYIVHSTVNRTLVTNNDFYGSGATKAIRNDGTNTNFGAGNRVNNGSWIVGAD